MFVCQRVHFASPEPVPKPRKNWSIRSVTFQANSLLMIPESSPRGYHWACWKGSCRCRSKWCWKRDLPSKVGPEASCLLDLTYESWSIMELLFSNRVPLQTFTFCHHVPSRVDINGVCSVFYFQTLPYAAIFMVQMTINHKILGCFWGFSGEWSLIMC